MNFELITQNLKERGYVVTCFSNKEEAAVYLDAQLDQKTVGFGGSVTLEELELYEKLSSHNRVFWHHRVPEGNTPDAVRREADKAEVYVSSVNGLAETGEIINIDGRCNRVASICYGHQKVFFVVGKNKIAPDYEGALWRARNIAGPLNAKRLGRKTPCAVKADKCYDCKSPDRICRNLSVLWEVPMGLEIEVVLVDEVLGY